MRQNVNSKLLERIGDTIPFRRAISLRGQDRNSYIDLGAYKRQMNRRRGDESELPYGTHIKQENEEDIKKHQKRVYNFTGEGSLAGIIERETVLHAPTTHEITFLKNWCKINDGFSYIDIGHTLTFESVSGYEHFIETVSKSIGADSDRRELEIRTVKIDHRRDVLVYLQARILQTKSRRYHEEVNKRVMKS